LDKIVEKLKGERSVSVIGYADERGDAYYNDMLSWRRAQSVGKYLQEKGLAAGDIKLLIGKGEINRQETNVHKQREDRRVDIVTGIPKMPEPVKEPPKPKPQPPPPPVVKEEEIDLEKVKEGETIALNNIQFLPGSPIVRPDSRPELQNLYDELKDNDIKIQIEGHVCCYADDKLSVERAQAVYDYLREKGISTKRMSYKGFSNTRPLVPELSEDDMAANRRVEIRVMKK
jgi:outer membrane protein OmpA-like peptidoglycan-associated protein